MAARLGNVLYWMGCILAVLNSDLFSNIGLQ